MSGKLDNLIVYGDSYSDTQPATRRTNGPLWSQQLAKAWDTDLLSFAQPGSTFCKNTKKNGNWLGKQIESYISSTKQVEEEKSTVHAIFLGVTELIETKGELSRSDAWIECIKDQVTSLRTNQPNARIVIMGVPALEFSPYASTHKEASKNLKQNIIDFNVALEEEVSEWQDTIKNVEFFDTYLVFSDLLGDPSVANIDNVDDAYWDSCQGKCKDNINNYLWWDSVHVTGAGHKAISSTIQSKEFFGLKATESIETGSSYSSGDSKDGAMGLSSHYTRAFSWFILACILLMFLYMFRHNRFVVSLKKKIQTKASKVYPSSGRNNNHDYTLV